MTVRKKSSTVTLTTTFAAGATPEGEHAEHVLFFLVDGQGTVTTPECTLAPMEMEVRYSMKTGGRTERSWSVRVTGQCPPGSWQKTAVVRIFPYTEDIPDWIAKIVHANLPADWEKYGD